MILLFIFVCLMIGLLIYFDRKHERISTEEAQNAPFLYDDEFLEKVKNNRKKYNKFTILDDGNWMSVSYSFRREKKIFHKDYFKKLLKKVKR